MKRLLLLIGALVAATMLFVAPARATADDDWDDDWRRYWRGHWSWYDHHYRPYYYRHHYYGRPGLSYYRYPHYYYGYHPHAGIRIGPLRFEYWH